MEDSTLETPEEQEQRERLDFFFDRPESEILRLGKLFHEVVESGAGRYHTVDLETAKPPQGAPLRLSSPWQKSRA